MLSDALARRCNDDGEFRLASRYWTGTLRFDLGGDVVTLRLDDGVAAAGEGSSVGTGDTGDTGDSGDISIEAPADVWAQILAPLPPPYYNDIAPAQAFGLRVGGQPETFWQYYPAVRRAVDLLRIERT